MDGFTSARTANGGTPPPIVEALTEVGLETIGDYISFHHTSVSHYIAMQLIFDLLLVEDRKTGYMETMLWVQELGDRDGRVGLRGEGITTYY